MSLREKLGLGPSSLERALAHSQEIRTELAERTASQQGEIAALQMRFNALQNRMLRDRAYRFGSGVPMQGGRFTYEQNTSLRGKTRWETLERMEQDPHIKGALQVNSLALINAEWDFQPASDDPRDMEIRDFVAANILRKSTEKFGPEFWVQTSWLQRLGEILKMLRDGFSMFAHSTRRQGRYVVYDRIKWLEPSTVDPTGWIIDDHDNLVAINRTYTTPTDDPRVWEPLTADEIDLFVWDLSGMRLEGNPMIRSMFGAWTRKENIQRWAMIWAQKVGAPLPIGYYPSGWDIEQIAAFEELVESVRGTAPAEGFGVFPMRSDGQRPEIEFAGSTLNVERGFTEIIDSENSEMSHAGNTKTEMLGETASGSRALGSVQSKREMQMISAIAKLIGEFVEHGVGNLQGMVERIVDLNFRNVRKYPELVCSKIDPTSGKEDHAAIVAGVKEGILPGEHPDLRRQYAERYGLELPDDAYEFEKPQPMIPNIGRPDDGDGASDDGSDAPDPNPDDDREEAEVRLESVEAFRERIAPMLTPVEGAPIGAGFRRPNRIELEIVNLALVQESFRIGERDILQSLRRLRADMTRDLMARLRAGKLTPRSVESQRRSKFRGQKRAVAALVTIFDRVGREGAGHVDDEIAAQKRGKLRGAA